jgi:23S rRNA (pseudouridine1915-N3)-methyltransferase
MTITLIQIGKTFFDYIEKGVDDYSKRITRYIKFTKETYSLPSKFNKLPSDKLKEKESELLMEVLKKYDYVILLDENGKEMTSVKFAKKLNELLISSYKNIAFVIGGAYGVTEKLRQKCDLVLSLSQMTFSHQLVRLVFAEQLYRAFTIIHNEKYHH